MTVDELIEKLAAVPGHYQVVVNQSREYEDYGKVSVVEKGMYTLGMCGGHFKGLNSLDSDEYPDAVLIA